MKVSLIWYCRIDYLCYLTQEVKCVNLWCSNGFKKVHIYQSYFWCVLRSLHLRLENMAVLFVCILLFLICLWQHGPSFLVCVASLTIIGFCSLFLLSTWLWVALNEPFLSIFLFQLLQIVANFQNGHTGQLSFIMVLLLFLGALARIFTTIQETGDSVMLVSFLVSSALNATLVLQVLYYWNVKPELKKKQA